MFMKNYKRILSLMLSTAVVLATATVEPVLSKADTTSVASGSGVSTDVTPSPSPSPAVDPEAIQLNRTSATLMAGKKITLTMTGTTNTVTYVSKNEDIASVTEAGVVKGLKKGTAVIEASVDGVVRTFTLTVVAKMSKKDFGKFNGENFVSFCVRKGYNRGYAWVGQWKGGSKKKTTYRGIKIGKSKSNITKAYGELTWKKCTSKDPFTKMKGLKKNKVKKYADVTYGKYRIRFYVNSKNKVVAIIYACNIGKIKKKALKSYM